MNYISIMGLNIFSALMSFILPESVFQLSLLFLSIVLTAVKCVEVIINIRIKKTELKKARRELGEIPK